MATVGIRSNYWRRCLIRIDGYEMRLIAAIGHWPIIVIGRPVNPKSYKTSIPRQNGSTSMRSKDDGS